MTSNTEREFKWQASHPRDFVRFAQTLKQCAGVSAPARVVLRDYYLQDASGCLSRQKMALRIRQIQNRFEATLKGRTNLRQGLAVRTEITLPLPVAHTYTQALHKLCLKGIWQGIDVRHLSVRFKIANQRCIYEVHYKKCICEAAFDTYITYAKGHQWTRREIELELKKGANNSFEELISILSQRSGLPAAKVSKVAGAEAWLQKLV